MKTILSIFITHFFYYLFFPFLLNHANATFAQSLKTPQATVRYSINPFLKGSDLNPVGRICITIPDGIEPANLYQLHFTASPESLGDIRELTVYDSKADSNFITNQIIGQTNIITPNFDLPITLQLSPGKQYLWFSVSLKGSAQPGDKLAITCTSLQLVKQRDFPITQLNTYAHPIGISIRNPGDDGVNTYRIPGLTVTDKGTLIAVYDIRYNNSKDLPEDIDVGMNRSTDGGRTWQAMKVIMDMGMPRENNGIGDPSILFDPVTKRLWVAALWSKGDNSIHGSRGGLSPDSTGQFMLAYSDDDGLHWSDPINITKQIKDPAWRIFFQGPGNGIAMQDGTLVFPAQFWDEKKLPHATIIYSTDHGKTWKRGNSAKSNTTESTVVEIQPGVLMLNMRDNRGKFRSIATTTDMGQTWTTHSSSYKDLPDPVCMGSLLKANVNIDGKKKEVLFFSNPNSSEDRINITIKASTDLGKTWLPQNQLLIDERDCYGYSSLALIDENTIGILYEGVKSLYFLRVPVDEILK